MIFFKRVLSGLGLGLLLGVLYAWADTLSFFSLIRVVTGVVFPPFSLETLHFALLEVGLCALVGAVVALLGGGWTERRPLVFPPAVALVLAVLGLFVFPKIDQIYGLSLVGIGAMGLLGTVAFRFGPRFPKISVALVPLMGVVWYLVLNIGMPPEPVPAVVSDKVPPATAPNILMIVWDTTRADRLSLYGNSRDTSPNLEAFAREGATFDRAYATASWTVPSHAAMFTGLYSSQHGCNNEKHFLDHRFTTLAEVLTEAGYNTGLFTGNPWLGEHTGLSQGFTVVHPSWQRYTLGGMMLAGRLETWILQGRPDKGALETREAFTHWFEDVKDDSRPFFALINYMEAHNPYHAIPTAARDFYLPEGVDGEMADEVSMKYDSRIMFGKDFQASARDREVILSVYDGAIHYVDERFQEIISLLRKEGKLDNTVVIVVGDHGEMFGENNIYIHEIHVFQPLIHVPLVIRWPSQVPPGVRIKNAVELVDVYQTVLEAAGLQDRRSPHSQGRSLLTTVADGGNPERPTFAEVFAPSLKPTQDQVRALGQDPATWRVRSAQVGDFSLIRYPGGNQQLFDLEQDPGQTTDVFDGHLEVGQRLSDLLDRFLKDKTLLADPSAPLETMDRATCEQLKALGYVEDCSKTK